MNVNGETGSVLDQVMMAAGDKTCLKIARWPRSFGRKWRALRRSRHNWCSQTCSLCENGWHCDVQKCKQDERATVCTLIFYWRAAATPKYERFALEAGAKRVLQGAAIKPNGLDAVRKSALRRSKNQPHHSRVKRQQSGEVVCRRPGSEHINAQRCVRNSPNAC